MTFPAPSLGDMQRNAANGLYIPESQSGINGVNVDTVGNGCSLYGSSPINTLLTNVPFPQMLQSFVAQLRTTGTFTLGKFTVEGSLDGTNWTELALLNATTNAAVAAGGFAFTTAATSLFTNAINAPLRYIRPRLSGGVAGGTAAFVALFLGGV